MMTKKELIKKLNILMENFDELETDLNSVKENIKSCRSVIDDLPIAVDEIEDGE